jgi:hypothetical protein
MRSCYMTPGSWSKDSEARTQIIRQTRASELHLYTKRDDAVCPPVDGCLLFTYPSNTSSMSLSTSSFTPYRNTRWLPVGSSTVTVRPWMVSQKHVPIFIISCCFTTQTCGVLCVYVTGGTNSLFSQKVLHVSACHIAINRLLLVRTDLGNNA